MNIIDKVWAFIAKNEEGEGLVAYRDPNGIWYPLIGADEARVESMREMAQKLCNNTDTPIHLVMFDQRTEIETLRRQDEPQQG